MTFEQYLNDAWNRHGNDAQGVFDSLDEGLRLASMPEHAAALAQLAVHVAGEHLGQWREGVAFIDQSVRNRFLTAMTRELEGALQRGCATLRFCERENAVLNTLEKNDRIRVLAVAASALSARGQTPRAMAAFREALELAQPRPDAGDPVARALAVTGNNLACALEEKTDRSPQERELMLLAAQTSRLYWEIAGTWLEVERAEYRLAMSHLRAGDMQKAAHHARACLHICHENKADDFELFYAHGVLARVLAAAGRAAEAVAELSSAKAHYAKLDDDNRKWAEESLAVFEKAVATGKG